MARKMAQHVQEPLKGSLVRKDHFTIPIYSKVRQGSRLKIMFEGHLDITFLQESFKYAFVVLILN